jgi:hypothetical protein
MDNSVTLRLSSAKRIGLARALGDAINCPTQVATHNFRGMGRRLFYIERPEVI